MYADVESEYRKIVDEKPFWGMSQPREWLSFMTFGKGQKCNDPDAESCVWATTNARAMKRDGHGRKRQRESCRVFRQELREKVNANTRLGWFGSTSLEDRKLNHSFAVYNSLAARKAEIKDLKTLCQIDPEGPHLEKLKALLLKRHTPPVFDLTGPLFVTDLSLV